MTKKELRIKYKQLRQEISSKEKLKLDDLLLLQLQKIDLNFAQNLLTYWGVQNNNEPNTHLFTAYLRHSIPNLLIAYPHTNFSENTMKAIEITEDTVYKTNAYLLTEPIEGNIVEPFNFDLIFVPLLICDLQGYRVGYGKGFYDKYLDNCREDCLKIGFSYFEPIVKIEDTEQFDIPLNLCITPQNIYEF